MEDKRYYHGFEVVRERCTGCTACVRVCPTEAMRVRHGKVVIDANRCIDCGDCITACKFNALVPKPDGLEKLKDFDYRIAIVTSAFAGQFSANISYKEILAAVKKLGFDEVIEASMVTDFMVKLIREYVRENKHIRPILSSNCPAVVRLIQVRFPSLLPNLLLLESPMGILANYCREKVVKEMNMDPDKVGIFNIVPCLADVTATHQPEGSKERLYDAAFSITDIYNEVKQILNSGVELDTDFETYESGLAWTLSGVEADLVDCDDIRTLSVNGIENVKDVLSKVEDHYLDQYDYIVVRNCKNGCVGGALNPENPFVAMSRIKKLSKEAEHHDIDDSGFRELYEQGEFAVAALKPRSMMKLDQDIKAALAKMRKINEILTELPGLNCSACGSPNCESLAEDIVQGKATVDDCIILYKQTKE